MSKRLVLYHNLPCAFRESNIYLQFATHQKIKGGTPFSLLVLASRAVDAAGAVGGGTAPDALVGAGAVAVLARGGVDASRTIA